MDTKNSENKHIFLEDIITMLLTIHHFSIAGIAIYNQWPSWVPVAIVMFVAINWLLVVGHFQTIRIRVMISAILVDCSLILYSVFEREMIMVMVPLAAISVVLALYGYAMILVPCGLTALIISFIQALVIRSIDFYSPHEVANFIFVILNEVMICLVLYFWVGVRTRAAEQQKRDVEELMKAQKGKDDFIANVSHEIRTPINTISGLSDILSQESDPTKLKDDLNRIRNAGKSLMFVVSDILDFSELENGVINLEEERYNISSTINDIVNMSTAKKEGKKIELIVNYPSDLPRGLYGDEKKIRRALMNIIGNAYKFTDEGSVVLNISWRQESYGINLCFSVKDTGIGMRPEDMDKLFSAYNQADASRSRAESGIGLGLAISRAIVQSMGGTISVYSSYQKGTEVRLVIPQKVIDSKPIITIRESEKINAGCYFNMEQFSVADTRDEYAKAIFNIADQLKVRTTICKNLAELKRRHSENGFTHIFISLMEYLEDNEFFDSISDKVKVVVVMDPENTTAISNKRIFQIYKPFQLMPIAQAINNELPSGQEANHRILKFEAPEVRVLVVDDNEMNIRVIAGLLKRYKIQIVQALSGAEALEKIESADFDFVFMDHMMPEMDGVEALHRIRKKAGDYFEKVPVIALTANAVAGAREMLLGEGFNDFIEKPVELSVLERLLLRTIPEDKIIDLTNTMSEKETAEALGNAKEESTEVPVREETKNEAAQEETALAKENSEGNYTYESLNLENGCLYCGGEESLEEILKIYANKGAENYVPIEELYEKEDWKNYTIAVHAVKSSMKSIGADQLSEQAKLLETAGRDGDLDYIHEHHEHVLEMYKALIHDLMNHYGVTIQESEDVWNLPVLEESVMQQICIELEDAMYNLDGDAMLTAIEPARGHRFKETALDPVIEVVEQKIKMSDYMSAADTFSKIK